MDISSIIKEYNLEKEIVEIRRHIHSNPELSQQEYATSDYICTKLKSWDIEFERCIAETGVVAIVRGKEKGNTVAVRADIDALPITEETKASFSSKTDGVMHACGHDAHVAISLVSARIISLLKDKIAGNVKFFFQPAEETIGGAERMIADGCLKNPEVDCVIGLHVEPNYEVGTIGIRYGKMYAASDMIDIIIKGKSAHGAHPDEGVDTIVVAANVINTIQTIVSRNVSALNSAVCTFGAIQGGTVRNQIADCTRLQGIIRTLDSATRMDVRNRVESVCQNVGKAMGADVECCTTESYGPLINNDLITKEVEKNAKLLCGDENVVMEEWPDLSCEDFSFFAQEKPSCYFHLGCHSEELGEKVDLHNSKFTIDERCLMIGTNLQIMNILSMLKNDDIRSTK